MNFVFWFILSIDFLIMLLHYLYSFEMLKKHKPFAKMKEKNEKLSSDMEEKITSNVLGKFIFVALTMISIVLLIAFLTSIIWLPITMWILFDWQSGVISFMLISALFSLFLIFIYVKLVPGYVLKEGAIVKEAIYVSFFILLSIYIRFGSPFPLDYLVESVYLESSSFNSTLSILVPVLIIGLLITNIYLFINGFAYIMDKSSKIVRTRTKILDILTIFTFSSFFGLFFVVDREWPFLNIANSTRYFQTMDMFKSLLVAVLVPLILSRFINRSSEKTINPKSSTIDNGNKQEQSETENLATISVEAEKPNE